MDQGYTAIDYQEPSVALSIAGTQLQDQLQYYRQKTDQNEREQMEQQEQADHMRQQIERIHGCENVSDQMREQIAELQKALSDSHLSIYDEKSHFM